MQSQRVSSPRSLSGDSPTAALGKHLRWQVGLACTGIFALVILLGYSSYTVATVLVPDHGGVFREGVAGNPRYLNPLYCEANAVDQDLCALIYRGLTKKDKQGRVIPDLALDWAITDNKVYTFRLRDNEFWHDGQPITVDDVIFTISVLQNPNVLSPPDLTELWRSVKVEKVNENTVRFTRAEPLAPFLDFTQIGLLPKHIYENVQPQELASKALNVTPIGSGPLMVKELAADHIRLEPSPYYAGKTPYLSALELWFYPDYPSLFSAFAKGEIDGISRILPADLPAAGKRTDLQQASAVESKYVEIIFNLNDQNAPFLQEKTVRQALYYGLDRKQLINQAAAGQGIPANSIMLPENWAYDPKLPQYAYDPARARQMLDQAGWVDSNNDGVRDKKGQPLQFILHTNDDPTHVALIQQIAAAWQQIGVRAVPTPVTKADLVRELLAPRHFDVALTEWEATGDPDPYTLWHSTQTKEGGSNFAGWSNEEADKVMERARFTTNEEERKQLYWRFQEIFSDELPALPLYYPVYTYGFSTRVHDVQIPSLNQPSERFSNFADWYIVTRRVPSNQIPTDTPPTPPGQ
ncbi:MAG: ABC transporter substrate-binding protein [Chloroflexi bacterium]|nr:ABC transporter substrate-binding protein [Chloroflexota bacterium]